MLWMPKEAGLHCSAWELRKPSASKKPFSRWSVVLPNGGRK